MLPQMRRGLLLILPRAVRTWLLVRTAAMLGAVAMPLHDLLSVSTSVWMVLASVGVAVVEERTRLREAVLMRNVGLPGWFGTAVVFVAALVAEGCLQLVRAGITG